MKGFKRHLREEIRVQILLIASFALCLSVANAQEREVVLLYTNDIESVYDPIDAYWIDSLQEIGGFPQLATLIKEVQAKERLSFLFDAGDIYTGALSAATEGKLPFDIYSTVGYDAMAVGNHEFEYGWESLRSTAQRARFPFLNANIFYEGTDIPFARSHAILEKDGFRIGVIGIMGIEAFHNTIHPKHRAGLEVHDPVPIVQSLVNQLRPEVDLVVLLTHQNKSAPMQSDKEIDPEVQRGFDEDYALAGAVEGIDILFGGHSDHGLWQPVQHPRTNTWIGLTFGQGKHLGYMKLRLDANGKVHLVNGKLLPVDADRLPPDQAIEELIQTARAAHPSLTKVIGRCAETGYRNYYRESNLGLFISDVLKEASGADIGWMNPGSFRADLDVGPITVEEIKNIYPFVDKWHKVEVPGKVLWEMLHYSLELHFGLAQLAGVTLTYDANKDLKEVQINGQPLDPDRMYSLTSSSYLTNGGDGYQMLAACKVLSKSKDLLIDDIISYIQKEGTIRLPNVGRQKITRN
ncbi:MAG: bifunctional metallophosphatase/5'-nucleotidase [Saprospiraceae bacterium]|nr:bifunctional metallophosphatase/5'-nucleotidase [Saprospiraceae bacterium]